MKAILPEIEKAYISLNKSLFGSILRTTTFILSPHKKGVVRFIPESFEMVVGFDICKTDHDAFLLHLLHEMVHVSNFQKGIVDCRQGQYHNTKFRDAALAVGLSVSRDRSHGWGLTSGEINILEKKEPHPDVVKRRDDAFALAKLNQKVLSEVQKKLAASSGHKRTFFLKYECDCAPPHNSIRSGRRPDGEHPLNIKCMCCNSLFHCVELI